MWRKRKSRNKISGNWRKFLWVFPCFIISILIYFLFASGILNINQVEVEADQLSCVDGNQLRTVVNLTGQNFFLINSVRVEENLKKKFPCIKSIALSKKFPNKITLQAFSRQPAAVLIALKDKEASISALIESIATPSAQEIEGFYTVDSEGVVFSKNTDEFNIPKIYLYDSKISLGEKIKNDLIFSLRILEKVKIFGLEVIQSWVANNLFIVLLSAEGPKVIFNLTEGIDVQLASLQLILDKAKIDLKELEFIDLRFDKPIVRFAPKK